MYSQNNNNEGNSTPRETDEDRIRREAARDVLGAFTPTRDLVRGEQRLAELTNNLTEKRLAQARQALAQRPGHLMFTEDAAGSERFHPQPSGPN